MRQFHKILLFFLTITISRKNIIFFQEKKKSREIKSRNGFVKPKSSEKKKKKSKRVEEKKKSREMNICGTCGKSFATSHTMQTHMEMVHEGIKNHQCKICKQKFTTKQCLVRHQDKARLKLSILVTNINVTFVVIASLKLEM